MISDRSEIPIHLYLFSLSNRFDAFECTSSVPKTGPCSPPKQRIYITQRSDAISGQIESMDVILVTHE